MISVVIYGRNDNHGYNLHKRAAISFNCIAEVLTDPTDEILFVDYNTPDDFPTFPEAIQDTLTERARNLLRIFRVRPLVHEKFKAKTHLVTLEPVARNVAVRRSNPSNRWILSTNTDMIFVPQRGMSLTEAVRELPDGIYHASRIEIPEALWESFDRKASRNIIDAARQWSHTLHLNEIILGSKSIRDDGPGDFQLLLRDDLFKSHGFDEEMLLGSHVDSNIAKRMALKYKKVGDFSTEVCGYHCDHTHQVTPAHSDSRLQNDWQRFVDHVDRFDVPKQAATWGCANDPIEELRLVANSAVFYIQALQETIGPSVTAPKIVEYTGRTYNKGDYDPPHLLPFLTDLFVSMPRNSNVAWYGTRHETLSLFANVWEKLKFTGKILIEEPAAAPPHLAPAIHSVPPAVVLAEAHAFIFDFGGLPRGPKEIDDDLDEVARYLKRSFLHVVRDERRRYLAGLPLRRLIALNAINNVYERSVCTVIAAPATPYATRMRHGFVLLPDTGKQNWLKLVSVGEAGIRDGHQIRSYPNKLGCLARGPHKQLDEGTYLLSLNTEPLPDDPAQPADAPCLIIEIFVGPECVDAFRLRRGDLGTDKHTFVFRISPRADDRLDGVEVRISLVSLAQIIILGLTIEPAPSPANTEKTSALSAMHPLLRLPDWLPFLQVGPAGRIRGADGIGVSRGTQGYVFYGPYWTLPAGHYELVIRFVPHLLWSNVGLVTADIAAETGERILASRTLYLGPFQLMRLGLVRELRLPFVLAADLPQAFRRIETRLLARGAVDLRIQSVIVRPSAPGSALESLSFSERIADALDEAFLRLIGGIRRRLKLWD